MPKYFLIERQSEGCDYTIGCGVRVSELSPKAKDLKSATTEAVEQIGVHWQGEDDGSIDQATLLEVSQEVNLAEVLDLALKERAIKAKAEYEQNQRYFEELEFERLKKKLSK